MNTTFKPIVNATLTISAIQTGKTNPTTPNAAGEIAPPSDFRKLTVTAVTEKGKPIKATVAMLFAQAYDVLKDSIEVGSTFTARVLMDGGSLKILGAPRVAVDVATGTTAG